MAILAIALDLNHLQKDDATAVEYEKNVVVVQDAPCFVRLYVDECDLCGLDPADFGRVTVVCGKSIFDTMHFDVGVVVVVATAEIVVSLVEIAVAVAADVVVVAAVAIVAVVVATLAVDGEVALAVGVLVAVAVVVETFAAVELVAEAVVVVVVVVAMAFVAMSAAYVVADVHVKHS